MNEARTASAPADARALIERDLDALQRRRRRHYFPALALAVVAIGGLLALLGLRPDIWAQPPLQLALQLGLWVLCLLVMPAVGLGLIFPGRAARVALVVGSSALTIGASLSWRPHEHDLDRLAAVGLDPCLVLQLTIGLGLVVLCALSGAFAERRRGSAAFWVAAGLALAALNTVTWHCPDASLQHVLPGHLPGVALLFALAGAVAFAARRMARHEG